MFFTLMADEGAGATRYAYMVLKHHASCAAVGRRPCTYLRLQAHRVVRHGA